MKKIEVSSYDYSFFDSIFELILLTIFATLSIISLVGILPLETVVFFIIPAVFILGLIYIKIKSSPEKIEINSGIMTYMKGNVEVFRIQVCEVESIVLNSNISAPPFHDKFFFVKNKDGSERSFSYRFLLNDDFKKLSNHLLLVDRFDGV